MGGKVVVMEPRDYAAWLAANGNDRKPLTAEQAGERIFKNVGCGTCHGEKDQPPVGPTLVGLFGKTRTLTNGAQYLADETYIRESIMRAGDKITKGYAGTMPTYQGKISEEEAMQLMAYIRSGATSTSVSSGTLSDDPTPTRRINAPAVGALASEANK
jgi:cytochrome c oxidase subunit 2